MKPPANMPQNFEQLVRHHHQTVYRCALHVLRSPEDAEDVTQQVYLRVLKDPATLRRAESPERVLCWLASRLSLNHLRGQRRRLAREEAFAMQQPTSQPGEQSNDLHTALQQEVDNLPEQLRLPLVLRFLNGLSFEQLADALSCSTSTAHERVQKGLERLRGRLASSLPAGAVLTDLLQSTSFAAAVPARLQERLLDLGQAAAASAAGTGAGVSLLAKPVFLLPALLALGLGSAALLAGDDDPVQPSPDHEATVAAKPKGQQPSEAV